MVNVRMQDRGSMARPCKNSHYVVCSYDNKYIIIYSAKMVSSEVLGIILLTVRYD